MTDKEKSIYENALKKNPVVKFDLSKTHNISYNDIDDLMSTAFEGGINYWCGNVDIIKKPVTKCEWAFEVIARGGKIRLYDIEDPKESWELDLDKFIKGLKYVMLEDDCKNVEELMENHDAETADRIIQYALFNEIVFG